MKENHIAIAMGQMLDDEGSMIINQLDEIERYVQMLRGVITGPEMQVPGWVQSKVTLATDYMNTVANYMSSKNEEVQLDKLSFKEFTEICEGAAWTKSSGKNKNGGLNEKGRKSYEKENPGSDLKAPSKEVGNSRRSSFCARMKGMKKKLTSKKTASDPDSRINKSLRAWNC
jgi:ribosomal protein L33